MDIANNIKVAITVDVSQALANCDALKAKIEEVKNAQAGLGKASPPVDDSKFKEFTASYSRQISELKRQAEEFQRAYQNTGDNSALSKYQSLIPQIQQLTKEQNAFNKSLKVTGGAFESLGNAFSRHMQWLFTGLGVGSAVVGITSAISDIAKLETEFTQLKTVLPGLEENQQTYNQAVKDSFALAERYGTKVKQVTESLRLMGRGYHELAESEKLAEIALKLGVADNFDPQTATKAIEAVVGSYGKQGEAIRTLLGLPLM